MGIHVGNSCSGGDLVRLVHLLNALEGEFVQTIAILEGGQCSGDGSVGNISSPLGSSSQCPAIWQLVQSCRLPQSWVASRYRQVRLTLVGYCIRDRRYARWASSTIGPSLLL